MRKHQTPNTKHQQTINFKISSAWSEHFVKLGFVVWKFFGVWYLVFGVFSSFALDGPLTHEESLKHLQTEPGLRVELVVAEPMVEDPVAIAWDEKGRLYVVEDRGYPTGPGKGKPPLGKLFCSKIRIAMANTTSARCLPTA
jgi:hypothetical protein